VADDLTQYRAMQRMPIRFTYRSAVIHTTPAPSVSGVALQRMLGIVARVEESEHNQLQQTVLNLESMKLAFEDLETYIGDPEINTVSAERLSAPSYLSYLADLTATRVNTANIDDLPTGDVTKPGTQDVLQEHSAHISIIDGDGNRVSVAISLNAPFGSGLVSRQTGIVLNNHLERFTDKQGKTAPRPVPQQRPTTYLAPTFIETADRALAMSTSGGKKTATTLLLGTQNQLHNRAFPDWLAEQRYHRDERAVIQFERHAFSRELLQQLKGQHYQLEELSYEFGNLQAVTWNKNDDSLEAGSDPRGSGQAIVRH
ncbi:MAG: gamma-glutamyltransferase, partial [Pseudomonadales bacterium]|nr:gamma-glutamyltransferase [Pseudomonadales bacterium]